VDDQPRIAKQIQSFGGTPHHSQEEMPGGDVDFTWTDAWPPIASERADEHQLVPLKPLLRHFGQFGTRFEELFPDQRTSPAI